MIQAWTVDFNQAFLWMYPAIILVLCTISAVSALWKKQRKARAKAQPTHLSPQMEG